MGGSAIPPALGRRCRQELGRGDMPRQPRGAALGMARTCPACAEHPWAAPLPGQLPRLCPASLCFRCLGCAQEHMKDVWHVLSLPQDAAFRMPNFSVTFVNEFCLKMYGIIFS